MNEPMTPEEITEIDRRERSTPLSAQPSPQAGAQVPSQDEREIYKIVGQMSANGTRATALYIMKLESSLQCIRDYALEAAKTPITRESILAAPRVDEAPIPERWKQTYNRCAEWLEDHPIEHFEHREADIHDQHLRKQLIGEIARLEAEARVRKLTELAQCDEMQGLCRLILSESGGTK
jgi:hypothetical protein